MVPGNSRLGEVDRARPRARTWALLAALTVLVAAVHLAGLDWQLPHYPESDEKVLWLQLRIARGFAVPAQEALFAHSYPSFLGNVADFVLPLRSTTAPHGLVAFRAWAAEDLLGLRALIAILAAGIFPATWFTARRFVGENWAFFAAGLASASTLALWFSSMARPHAVLAMFTTATVAASLRARASGRVRDFLLAGAFAALALATLQSGACACAAVAAAWWWNARPRFGRPLLGAVLAAGLVVATFLACLRGAGLPAAAHDPSDTNALFSFLGVGTHHVDAAYFDGGGFLQFANAMRNYEPVLALLGALGFVVVVLALLRGRTSPVRRALLGTAAGHSVLHILVFGIYGQSFQRFWLPIVPYLAILAAIGVSRALAAVSGRSRLALRATFAALLALQLVVACKIVVLRVRDDTNEVAAAWVLEHPEGAPFHVGPTVNLPLVSIQPGFRTELLTSYKHFIPWTLATTNLPPEARAAIGIDLRDLPLRNPAQRQRLGRDAAAWFDDIAPGTFLVESQRTHRRALLRIVREQIDAHGSWVRTFDPQPEHRPGTRSIDYWQDSSLAIEDWFVWNLLCASRVGPEIEVFSTLE